MYGCDSNFVISLINSLHECNSGANNYYSKIDKEKFKIILVSQVDKECVSVFRRKFESIQNFILYFSNNYTGANISNDIKIEAKNRNIPIDFLDTFLKIYISNISDLSDPTKRIEISRLMLRLKQSVRDFVNDFIDHKTLFIRHFAFVNDLDSLDKINEIKSVLPEINIYLDIGDDLVIAEHIHYSQKNGQKILILTNDNAMISSLKSKDTIDSIKRHLNAELDIIEFCY